MKKNLCVMCIILSTVNTANAETFFSKNQNAITDTSQSSIYWAVPNTMSSSVAEATAISNCREQYCDVHVPTDSNGGAPDSAFAQTFAITAATKEYVSSGGSSGDETETSQTYPIATCPTG